MLELSVFHVPLLLNNPSECSHEPQSSAPGHHEPASTGMCCGSGSMLDAILSLICTTCLFLFVLILSFPCFSFPMYIGSIFQTSVVFHFYIHSFLYTLEKQLCISVNCRGLWLCLDFISKSVRLTGKCHCIIHSYYTEIV